MSTAALALHSLLRWVLLGLGLASLLRSLRAWRAGRDWSADDEVLARSFMMAFFLQLGVGYLLYAELSPVTAAAFQNLAEAMRDRALRFFVAEHPAGMMFAFMTAMAARVRTRNASAGASRHRDWVIGLGVASVVMALFIPWPGLRAGRPLLRMPW